MDLYNNKSASGKAFDPASALSKGKDTALLQERDMVASKYMEKYNEYKKKATRGGILCAIALVMLLISDGHFMSSLLLMIFGIPTAICVNSMSKNKQIADKIQKMSAGEFEIYKRNNPT